MKVHPCKPRQVLVLSIVAIVALSIIILLLRSAPNQPLPNHSSVLPTDHETSVRILGRSAASAIVEKEGKSIEQLPKAAPGLKNAVAFIDTETGMAYVGKEFYNYVRLPKAIFGISCAWNGIRYRKSGVEQRGLNNLEAVWKHFAEVRSSDWNRYDFLPLPGAAVRAMLGIRSMAPDPTLKNMTVSGSHIHVTLLGEPARRHPDDLADDEGRCQVDADIDASAPQWRMTKVLIDGKEVGLGAHYWWFGRQF